MCGGSVSLGALFMAACKALPIKEVLEQATRVERLREKIENDYWLGGEAEFDPLSIDRDLDFFIDEKELSTAVHALRLEKLRTPWRSRTSREPL